jgi:hypothetical protein
LKNRKLTSEYRIFNSPSQFLRLGLPSILEGGRYLSKAIRNKYKKHINKLNERNKSYYYFSKYYSKPSPLAQARKIPSPLAQEL